MRSPLFSRDGGRRAEEKAAPWLIHVPLASRGITHGELIAGAAWASLDLDGAAQNVTSVILQRPRY